MKAKQENNSSRIYDESAVIPTEAVYLGADMGGDFVVLKRQDITLGNGRVLPAFYLEYYRAWSAGTAYGKERIGRLIFKGPALYVPPQKFVDENNGATLEPPSVEDILVNDGRWVNFGVLHVRLKPYAEDPNNEYIATIVPLKDPNTLAP